MEQLKLFYDNQIMREEFKQFIVNHIREYAISKALNGESTQGVKEANEILLAAYDSLHERFANKERPPIKSNR